ncbi:molybdopterin-dependent oxidoreductase [Egicoccus sp. AB-alg6-2]|uniref:molybdopterin-dependent oxidoreductase n=1 Tax=Egicoccus sp. AB-alg6-2 TaxID=3242692 RepID=UPI00359DF77B
MTADTTAPVRRPPDHPAPAPRWLGAVSGALAATAALGAGELTAALSSRWPSPVVAIADRVVVLSPTPVTAWAIRTFGTLDKPLLVGAIVVVLAAAAAGLGMRARRRPLLAAAGVAGLGGVAVLAGLLAPEVGPSAALPGVVATVVGVLALLTLAAGLARYRPPLDERPGPAADREEAADRGAADGGRRRFLLLAATVGAGAVAMGTASRFLLARFEVDAAREALALPRPTERRDLPAPADASLDVDGLSPLFTPNDAFYRIDTAFSVPRIDPRTHQLRVTGMVDRPLTVDYQDLLARDLIELPITLSCVSNEIGGDLVGNAVWLGFPLRDLLDEAGVSADADQVVGRAVDGFTAGFPVAAAYDRDALVVVGMNGAPLPPEHGFPLRLVTPGLYGYVSATKWLAEIELTRFDRFDAYWIPRGWAAEGPVKTMSRIDVPAGLDELRPGTVAVAGVAWAPTRGVERVEVQIDDGPWQPAELAAPVNDLTWRQWVLRWDATPGRHRIRCRATDGTGATQPEERVPVRPDGATGWHTITVTVDG